MDTRMDGPARSAEKAFAAGEFSDGYRLAQEALRERPDDPGLLALAGRAALELGLPDAVAYLTLVVGLEPGDAAAWRDLGMAHLDATDLAGAERALRTAVRLDPEDVAARIHLGHVAYQAGAVDEAIAQLRRSAEAAPRDREALRSLVAMNRLAGRPQAALEAALELAGRAPEEVPVALDVAELHLRLGNGTEALAAYRRLREIDTEVGHAAYLYHGMIEVEVRRERWRSALDLTITATLLDRRALTTDLLQFVSAQIFGPGDRPVPDRADIERLLGERRAEHRGMHADALLPGGITR